MSTTKKRPVARRQERGTPALPSRPFQFTDRTQLLIGLLAAASAIVAGLLYLIPMESTVGAFGFPSDDSYISLTFAKNLREFGSYSYFQNAMVTSGSTSPLYVFLLALLGLATSHGVAAAALLGVAAFAVAAWMFFRLALHFFAEEQWLAAVAVALFVLFPRMHGAAVSGAAAMLYTALTLASAYAYFTRKTVLFFALAGLALWVRPDALVFMLAALMHLLYHHFIVPKGKTPAPDDGMRAARQRDARIGGTAFLVLVAAYAGFNLALSGTVFPNAVGAKLAYYHDLTHAPFLAGVFSVLSSAGGAVLVVFAVIGALDVLAAFARRQPAPLLMATFVALCTVTAYGVLLPFLFDDARVLVPILPFVILLGVHGVRRVTGWMQLLFPIPGMRSIGNGFSYAVFGGAIVLHLAGWSASRSAYYSAVRYVEDRQVAAARWIRNSTPAEAVVATNVIGAIGYYGQRRIIDMTGVMTPGLIPSIGNLEHLEAYVKGMKTTIVATVRERMEIANTNPVFTSDPRTPEVMEVFAYLPGRTHIMVQRASALNQRAAQLMASRLERDALPLLRQSYELDRNSARTCTLLGVALLNLKDTASAVDVLQEALRLHPDYAPAMVPLADVLTVSRAYTSAISLLRKAVALSPNSQIAQASLERAVRRQYEDSLAAQGYVRMRLKN